MAITENHTHAEILSQALKDISVNVTTADRAAAVADLNLSKGTISKYLSGTVLDNDTGVKILTFFREKVAARFDKINL